MGMQSKNFEFLRSDWPELANLGGFAEAYLHTDPSSSLVKLRIFAENVTKYIYYELKLQKMPHSTFLDLLNNENFKSEVPSVVISKLNALRIHGNKAAHGDMENARQISWLLKEAFDVARWVAVQFNKSTVHNLPNFAEIPAPNIDSKSARLKREKRAIWEKFAAKEAENQKLLEELETLRATAGERVITTASFSTQESVSLSDRTQFMSFTVAPGQKKAPSAFAKAGEQNANILEFDEATTRARIIDSMLASVGWNVGPELENTSEVGKEIEVYDQPTETGKGYADYVLWDDDGNPLAVIEVKKTSENAKKGQTQAKLYADSMEKDHGQRPIIFYTNGYDIWVWDDLAGYPPRKIYGYYSKDSLQYLVKHQRINRKAIQDLNVRSDIVNRLYQLEAITRVSERFENKHRKALVVLATGTGKTRVSIALVERLMRAGWVKRVLFLCDRKELRKQAKNAFTDFLPSEPIKVVSGKIDRSATERVFLATYPAMQRVFQSFDVGYFDLIIADESHRSVYNVYGDIFNYFDSLQVGLTATPVDFVAKSTFDLFGCESQAPTANYSLEEAVNDSFLVPYEVIDYTTQFMRDGIQLDGLNAEQIRELEEQGEDPSQFNFDQAELDRIIYNKDTNRVILRNLMEQGLRGADGQTLGKTIIFARNHTHALLLNQIFDEMYPQYGGKFCQVIDNYDPRAEQLIDDFKDNAQGKNTDLTIAISVDMLDTGIDIPEILNLVFAKPVKSQVKFWQMIGRGTRLSLDLFGPGKHKTNFQIFDHWGNFERFETGYKEAKPALAKSLMQLVFEERLNLCELALSKSEPSIFDLVITLVEKDINDLPEESIAVREKWKEKRTLQKPETLHSFDPTTVIGLREILAPLMQWRDIRGNSDAYSFDLLITRLQIELLKKSTTIENLKIEVLDRLSLLRMNLSQVREKAEVIKTVKSDEFWQSLSVKVLEDIRGPLREIIHHRGKLNASSIPPKVIDVQEAADLVHSSRRKTNLLSANMKAYRHVVETELKKFEKTETFKKIRRGEAVSERDVQSLVSMVLIQTPGANKTLLEEFFSETADAVEFAIRSIIGLDPDCVDVKLSEFTLKHPVLNAKQTSFLVLLKNHIVKFGSITPDKLYEEPFKSLDSDGPDGIFPQPEAVDNLMDILKIFRPPKALEKMRAHEIERPESL